MSSAVKKNYKNTFIAKSWLPQQMNLIRLVKEYLFAYLESPKNKTLNKDKLDSIWEEIASKFGQPSKRCKVLWTNIKLKYAKIMILIKTGKITKEVAMSHPETNKFFDGNLFFLNPYIHEITDEDIPVAVHKYINDFYGLKTTRLKGLEDNCSHFVTHAQVASLLKERQLSGDVVDYKQMEYLQAAVDFAVQHKLGKLMRNASSNSNNDSVNIDDEDTVNITMMPNKNVQIVRKRKASSTLNLSEDRTKSINLGLQSELIIEDEIKLEKEGDVKKEEEDYVNSQDEVYENIQDEDIVKAENFTMEKNINNTADGNFDMENILPRAEIIQPVRNMEKNTLGALNEHAIITEDITDDMTDNAPPVTDEYLRNFFAELGAIMSTELTFGKQKILQSRINELLKNNLLKDGKRDLIP